MLFPTVAFAVFFLLVFCGRWALARRPVTLKAFLLAASYIFYGWWDWRFLGLIAASSILNHLLAIAMARRRAGLAAIPGLARALAVITTPILLAAAGLRSGWIATVVRAWSVPAARIPDATWALAGVAAFGVAMRACDRFVDALRRAPTRVLSPAPLGWRIVAVAVNLGFLGFFKYYGFVVENFYRLCSQLAIPCPLPLLDIILPVGISFFTFQAMSYVLDVARGEIDPAESLLDFSVYLAFFPQLVAGPIVRASVLLPQVARPAIPDRLDLGRATVLILAGLFKKIVVANFLGTSVVDPVFAHPASFGAVDTLVAVYAYAVQIYCDFSAYSDIAIGVALLLGFHFPINFDAPYFADSLQAFWRRWHISLSTWLRDYLYIPLGGSRVSRPRVYANLLTTFLLGGLWHGAGWTFVAWGLLHGVGLGVERILRDPGTSDNSRVRRLLRQVVTFHLVCLSWVFFRAETFGDAWTLLGNLGRGAASRMLTPAAALWMVVGFASQGLDGDRIQRVWRRVANAPGWMVGLLAALVLTLVLGLGPKGVAPFIYFQF